MQCLFLGALGTRPHKTRYTHVGRHVEVPNAEQRAAIIAGSAALQQALPQTQQALHGNEKLAAQLLQWLAPMATLAPVGSLHAMLKAPNVQQEEGMAKVLGDEDVPAASDDDEEAALLVQLQAALDGYTHTMEEIKVWWRTKGGGDGAYYIPGQIYAQQHKHAAWCGRAHGGGVCRGLGSPFAATTGFEGSSVAG